jgi:hypothetical protein
MTSPKPNVLELAKQGNPKAIEALLNRQLQPKGITAKVALKSDCLQIMLESAQIPDQQILLAFIHRGIAGLNLYSVNQLKLYGKQIGTASPAWNTEVELKRNDTSGSGVAQKPTTIVPQTRIDNPKTRVDSSVLPLSVTAGNTQSRATRVTQIQTNRLSKLDLLKRPQSIILVAIAILFLGGFSFSLLELFGSNPQKTVDAFLANLSKADEKNAMNYWCFQDGSKLFAVRSWEVIRQEDKKLELEVENLSKFYPQIKEQLEKINGAKYTEIIARVDSSNQGGMQITGDWTFKVWRTKDLERYSAQVDAIMTIMEQNTPEDLSSLSFEQLSEQSDALGARVEFTKLTLHMVGESKDLTSKAYCITSLEEK